MRKKILKSLLILVLIVSLSSFVSAQRITQSGRLTGTVIDTEGIALPGVTVTASSPALMLPQVTSVTDDKGFFRIAELPSGLYKVVFELTGFKTFVRESQKISPAKTTTYFITMEPSPIEETVTVIGKAPTIDVKSTSLGITFDKEFLQNMPTSRNFFNIFSLAPGVIDAGGSEINNAGGYSHGSSVRDNSFILDGVSIDDPTIGTIASGISYEIAEEYSIETTGQSAEYGGIRGGVMNIITKSGGNRYSGQLSFYFRNKKLQSDNTKDTPFEGQFVGFNNEVDGTAQLGGPILKDKLWFFANFSYYYRERFVSGYPYDKETNTPIDFHRGYPYLKLSWQITPSMKFVSSFNASDEGSDHSGASMYLTEEASTVSRHRAYTLNFQYSYVISKNLIVTAKGGLLDYKYHYEPKNDKPQYYDWATWETWNSKGWWDRYDRSRFQFLADTTYFLDNFYGRHEWKVGFEFQYIKAQQQVIQNKDPRYGMGPYVNHWYGEPYFLNTYEDHTKKDQGLIFGSYIQDYWNPTDRLTLNFGLRFDHSEGIIPPQGQDRSYEPNRVLEKIKLMVWNVFSPRIGASFDITGDGKTVLKASFGRYYLAFITDYIWTVNPNGGVNRRYWLNPDWTLGNMYYFWAASANEMDPNIKSPHLDEFVVSIQRELLADFSLSVSFIRKWDRQLINQVDQLTLDVEAIKRGEYIWSGWEPVTAVDPYDGKTVTFYQRDSGSWTSSYYVTNLEPAKRDYTGFEVVLNKRFSHNWQMIASYVYSKTTGLIGIAYWDVNTRASLFQSPNVHINAEGRLPNERRHQIKFQGTYRAPLGFIISGYYHGLSGKRYTRRIYSGNLGLWLQGGGWTINAEPKGSRGLPFLHLLDLRVEKEFKIKESFSVGLIVDAFNVLNRNTNTEVYWTSSNPGREFEDPVSILDARIFRLGIRIRW